MDRRGCLGIVRLSRYRTIRPVDADEHEAKRKRRMRVMARCSALPNLAVRTVSVTSDRFAADGWPTTTMLDLAVPPPPLRGLDGSIRSPLAPPDWQYARLNAVTHLVAPVEEEVAGLQLSAFSPEGEQCSATVLGLSRHNPGWALLRTVDGRIWRTPRPAIEEHRSAIEGGGAAPPLALTPSREPTSLFLLSAAAELRRVMAEKRPVQPADQRVWHAGVEGVQQVLFLTIRQATGGGA